MGLDVWGLQTYPVDGLAIGEPYSPPTPPKHDLVPAEGEKIYTGNCHCGKVKLAVKTKPLTDIRVARCNCSICIRVMTPTPFSEQVNYD